MSNSGRRGTGFLALALVAISVGGLLMGPAKAAATSETFSLDEPDPSSGIPAGTYGHITITGDTTDLNDVTVNLTLTPNTTLVVNTGGPHTPFGFNLTTAAAAALDLAGGSAITVTAPVGSACSPASSPCFAPTYATVPATPFGNFNEGFTYTGQNGGAGGNTGPLIFTIYLTGIGTFSGGVFTDFVNNSNGAIFEADLLIPPTGTVVNGPSTPCIPNTPGCPSTQNAPEPASLAVLGVALMGLGAVRRRWHF